MQKLSWCLALAVWGSACDEPCKPFRRDASQVTCGGASGAPRFVYAPISAGGEVFVDSCDVYVEGGALAFEVSIRACPVGTSQGMTNIVCEPPPLSPGRYVFPAFTTSGVGALDVFEDGGTACVE